LVGTALHFFVGIHRREDFSRTVAKEGTFLV